MTLQRKINLDFKRVTGAQAGAMAEDTLSQGGYDSEGEHERRDAEAMERGREASEKIMQMQKEALCLDPLQQLIKAIAERDGHFKGRKIILAIDDVHTQIPAQKMKSP